jgi:hypothetical protein
MTNSKKKTAVGNGGGPKEPSGHWTQWIPPKGAALLAQMMGRCRFIIKNHGPESVKLVAAGRDSQRRNQPAACGRQVCCGIRQSMPSSR